MITMLRINLYSELVEGFETLHGLELLSTVHWAVTQENALNIDEATAVIHQWSKRKKAFSPHQIGIAYRVLQEKNWI